ncbi:ethylmalonyl-CoA decarboxylase isoform X2 [Corythoichthys intestinalis]|nr:ethylmalonyl-CoA decarboxylase isoform X2 [Corythoichthys intestinalis]XP_061789271.1 ethylmalonyl-CoA decarboxylase-like [Nerophis lumbriciformis]
MVICTARHHILRANYLCGRWARMWQRQMSEKVYTERDFDQEDLKAKLLGLPGGSVDLTKQDSGIGILTINNPSYMNAFSGTMMVQLEEKVSQLEKWTDGKGLIVQGAAGTFCSGSDLNAVKAISKPDDGMKMCMFMQNTLTRLLRLPLISVALVEGRALGGGAELTTACDFRLMAPESVIQFVHKHMGVVPGWGGAARLVNLIGSRNSVKLLSGALKVDPDFGLQVNLVDGLLKDPQLEEGVGTFLKQTEKWLSHYTKGPAPVVQAMKKVVLSGRELPLVEALRTEKEVFGTVWGGPANMQALANKTKYK